MFSFRSHNIKTACVTRKFSPTQSKLRVLHANQLKMARNSRPKNYNVQEFHDLWYLRFQKSWIRHNSSVRHYLAFRRKHELNPSSSSVHCIFSFFSSTSVSRVSKIPQSDGKWSKGDRPVAQNPMSWYPKTPWIGC